MTPEAGVSFAALLASYEQQTCQRTPAAQVKSLTPTKGASGGGHLPGTLGSLGNSMASSKRRHGGLQSVLVVGESDWGRWRESSRFMITMIWKLNGRHDLYRGMSGSSGLGLPNLR